MVMNPVLNWVILNYGWQMGYYLLGTIVLVTLLPIVLFIVALHPSEKGLQPYGEEVNSAQVTHSLGDLPGLTLGQTVKTGAFWVMGLSFLLFMSIGTGVQNHVVPYLTDLGHSSTMAANVLALIMAVLIVGKMALGAIADRWGLKVSVLYAATLFILAILVLMGAKDLPMEIIFALFFGLAAAVNTVLSPLITAKLFGQKDFGVKYGVVNIFITLGAGIGMPLSAAIYDAKHSYMPAWYLYIVFAVLAAIGVLFAFKHSKKLIAKETISSLL
jgi:MFS family permease